MIHLHRYAVKKCAATIEDVTADIKNIIISQLRHRTADKKLKTKSES